MIVSVLGVKNLKNIKVFSMVLKLSNQPHEKLFMSEKSVIGIIFEKSRIYPTDHFVG